MSKTLMCSDKSLEVSVGTSLFIINHNYSSNCDYTVTKVGTKYITMKSGNQELKLSFSGEVQGIYGHVFSVWSSREAYTKHVEDKLISNAVRQKIIEDRYSITIDEYRKISDILFGNKDPF